MFDFPNSPTVGQTYNGYTWDGEKWMSVASSPNQSGVVAIKVFTASGSYLPSASMTTCVVECVGSGGGGGGANTANSTQQHGSGGGGSGSYSRSTLTAAQVGASQTITIGAAGTGGAAGANDGANGGDVSFGSLVIAKGGGGGQGTGAASGKTGRGGAGGVAGTGQFVSSGSPGGGNYTAAIATFTLEGGQGASSIFGGGALSAGAAAANNGVNATGYGAGGGGAYNYNAAAKIGGNGSSGIVIVTEYGMTALSSTNVTGAVRYDVSQTLTVPQQTQAQTNIGISGGGGGGGFPAGTAMLFQQTAAPTGWTKQTTHNDKALRVVSGTPSSGGSVAFSTLFGRTQTDGFTMSATYMSVAAVGVWTSSKGSSLPSAVAGANPWGKDSSYGTNATHLTAADNDQGVRASGGAHAHTIDMRVSYVDVIIATKD